MHRSNGVVSSATTVTKADIMENRIIGKKRVAVLFGGESNEHEVSLRSSVSVVKSINRSEYELILIGIDKCGRWALYDETDYLMNSDDTSRICLIPSKRYLALVPGHIDTQLIEIASGQALPPIDVAFSVLHGAGGENGSVQGTLAVLNIPFVASGVLGSSVCMDKDMTKRVLRDAGLPVAPWVTLRRTSPNVPDFDAIVAELGLPLFVKPASQGSSIGVSKVEDKASFHKALALAFSIDPKVLVEPAINGREIETAVLGNDHPDISACGEVITDDVFYTYNGKYDINGSKITVVIPANLEPEVTDEIRRITREAFRVAGCAGTARVDVFYTEQGEVIINEINTLPGLTPSSVYPKLWEASGVDRAQLVSRLLSLALESSWQTGAIKPDR